MNRVPCFNKQCRETFVSIRALLLHKDLRHPQRSNHFYCAQNDCGRSFSLWNSFTKHLTTKHGILRHIEPIPVESDQHVEHVSDTNDPGNDPMSSDEETQQVNEQNNFVAPEVFSISDCKKTLKNCVDMLIAKWYNKPGLARNVVEFVVDDVSSFLGGGFLECVQSNVTSILKKNSADQSDQDNVNEMFELAHHAFDHVSSEYKRQNYFEKSGFYVPPEKYVIQSRIERSNTNSGVVPTMKDVTGEFMSLRKNLKLFFELPDAFNSVMTYLQSLKTESILVSNFVQGTRWKDILARYGPDDKVLPLHIYYDDFESNNVLGPHSEKIGAVYGLFPWLRPECQSKLENIFEILFFNADDRKMYGNEKTFKPLTEELKVLENEGIIIDLPDGPQRLFFVTGLLCADNLGLHGMCGFTESFVANFICRFCKANKRETEKMCEEDESLLRTAQNYREDVNTCNVSLTGIKEKCVFLRENFDDITVFQGCDSMHDGSEGVYHYTMIAILKHFHSLDPSFLETLNHRMYFFDYGPDKDNQPTNIIPELLNKGKLKMTAAEMITFVRFFGIFVGDLVSEDDDYWQLYLLLHEIGSVLQAKKLPEDISQTLKVLVEEHHKLYLKLTNDTLKPKHHYFVHYPRVFRMAGPFSLYCSMRPEGNHKVQKAYANVCLSRKNFIYSLAVKRQLARCMRFMAKESILPKPISGPGDLIDLTEMEHYRSFKRTLPKSYQIDQKIMSTEWVEFKSISYKQKMVLVVGVDEVKCICFGTIELILIRGGNPCFVCSPIENVGYDSHVRAYLVEKSRVASWFSITIDDL